MRRLAILAAGIAAALLKVAVPPASFALVLLAVTLKVWPDLRHVIEGK